MKLYGIKSCDTCRKALKMIGESGQEVEFIDVRDTPLGADKLAEFFETIGDQLLNVRSTTWRGLDDATRARSPLELLAEHPTLMKRPVIEADKIYVGWKKDVQDALL